MWPLFAAFGVGAGLLIASHVWERRTATTVETKSTEGESEMATSRCGDCDINYPHGHQGCDVCGGILHGTYGSMPHKDWEFRVLLALANQSLELRREGVVKWRFDHLVELGFSESIAEVFADMLGFDWHEAERLVKAGCPIELAEQILA